MKLESDIVLDALRGLAEPTRLRLIALLSESELTVTDLVKITGQSQPRLSRHLKLLCDAELLEREPEGAYVYYRLAAAHDVGKLVRLILELVDWEDPLFTLDRARLAVILRSRSVTAEIFFKQHAAEWDAIRSLHIPESRVEQEILNQLPKKPVKDLIDLGTGTGRMLQLCAARTEHAVGVDLSREMLAVARANLDGSEYRHCVLRHASAERLPYPDKSFDVAVSHMVMHFLSDPGAAIVEAARVLRPRGRLILVDFAPHDASVLGPEHAHRWPGFSDASMAKWFEAAGLIFGRPVTLQGYPLTVKLWRGERPAIDVRAPAPAGETNFELSL